MAHPLPYLLLAAVLLVPFAAYSESEAKKGGAVHLANPATEYCVTKGGSLEIRESDHGRVGYCHLPDGRVVEEWALFRAENTLTPKKPENADASASTEQPAK